MSYLQRLGVPSNRDFLGVEFKKMPHDKLYGGFVDVIVFAAVCELGQTAEGLVDRGHLKGRKIKNMIMPSHEFISCRAQGRLGIAAGADNIYILPKSGPQINR